MRKRTRYCPEDDLPYQADEGAPVCCWPACGCPTRHNLPLCMAHLAVAANLQRQLAGGEMPVVRARVRVAVPERPAVAPAPLGTVYFVQVGAHIKIGWTSDLEKRMKQYPPNSVLLAAHPGTRKDETRMHRRFAASRTHGREWYALVPSLLHHIEAVKAEHGAPATVSFGAQPVTIPQSRPVPGLRVRDLPRRVG